MAPNNTGGEADAGSSAVQISLRQLPAANCPTGPIPVRHLRHGTCSARDLRIRRTGVFRPVKCGHWSGGDTMLSVRLFSLQRFAVVLFVLATISAVGAEAQAVCNPNSNLSNVNPATSTVLMSPRVYVVWWGWGGVDQYQLQDQLRARPSQNLGGSILEHGEAIPFLSRFSRESDQLLGRRDLRRHEPAPTGVPEPRSIRCRSDLGAVPIQSRASRRRYHCRGGPRSSRLGTG